MKDVVALGELLIDFAPVSTDEAGYPTLKAQPGGAPGNFLAALQKYGCTTGLIGKVGDDAFGHLLAGGDAAVDVDEHRLHLGVGQHDLQAFLHDLGREAQVRVIDNFIYLFAVDFHADIPFFPH